jgi:pteridine reductase
MDLSGKTILVTGAARRIGRALALAAAHAGADVVIHHAASPDEATSAANEIRALGRRCWKIQADFSHPEEAQGLISRIWQVTPLDAVIHNAAIFEPHVLANTSLEDWQKHLDINLTAPFLISQAFAGLLPAEKPGRILTILDWRALRPGADHLPYTISKAALAALTKSLAVALAPRIQVNGLALGAILPPSDGGENKKILENIPAGRWAELDEVTQAALFFLSGPEYITGEILHIDGGRHLR